MRLTAVLVVLSTFTLGAHLDHAAAQDQSPTAPAFRNWDKDKDGFVSPQEFPKRMGQALFDRVDTNQDGKISQQEDTAFRAKNRNAKKREVANVQRDIIYATVGDRKLPLDLHRPAKSLNKNEAMPLVIWIHGGGWKSGSKNGIGPAAELLSRGYAVASVEYRLSGEAIFPAAVNDCKAAISFLRANASKFNIDPQRFGVWGSSAGGHLAAMVGTTGDTDEFEKHPIAAKTLSHVQAVCDWFGPTDFLRMNDVKGSIDHDAANSPESKFIGGPIQSNQKKVQQANPITYVSAADPPFLIMNGDADKAVPYGQSEQLHAALKKAGIQSELVMIKKGEHGFRGAEETRDELAERGADFFDSILRANK